MDQAKVEFENLNDSSGATPSDPRPAFSYMGKPMQTKVHKKQISLLTLARPQGVRRNSSHNFAARCYSTIEPSVLESTDSFVPLD